MAITQSTKFEILRALHTLWSSRNLDTVQIKTILKQAYDLELTVLTNGQIAAQTPDAKTKYSIK
jgi:ssDNA-specific exonuclease RecJ